MKIFFAVLAGIYLASSTVIAAADTAGLAAALADNEKKYAILGASLGPEHPQMKALTLEHAALVEQLTVAGQSIAPAITHIAVVVDTSGSMRDPKTDQLYAAVVQAIDDTLDLFPGAKFLQVVDADGRVISKPGWVPNLPANRSVVLWDISNYPVYSVSNPAPGLRTILRSIPEQPVAAKLYVVVIGDELVSEAQDSIPGAIAGLNPVGSDGKQRARISAIQVPTTSGTQTAADFERVMKRVTVENSGTLVKLDRLAMLGAPSTGAPVPVTTVPTWNGLTIFKGPITSAPPEPAPPGPTANGK